jgi:hypothetical protein
LDPKVACRAGSAEIEIEIEIAIEIEIDFAGGTGGWHWQRVASVAQQQEASPKSAICANESLRPPVRCG